MRHDTRASVEELREAAARADEALQTLKDASPQQINTWISNHVTTLGEARALIAKMLYIIARLIP
jgi:uncharacterized MAPEG superfamily protein